MNATATPAVGEAGREASLGLNPYTLWFADVGEEQRYQEVRKPADVRHARRVLLFVTVLAAPFMIFMAQFVPPHLWPLYVWSHAAELALILLLFGLTFVPYFRNCPMLLMTTLAAFLVAVFAIWNAITGVPDVYVMGGVVLLIAIYVFPPLDFPWGVTTALGCSILYLTIVGLAQQMALTPFLAVVIFTAIANAIGVMSLYHAERLRRLDFAKFSEAEVQRARHYDLLVKTLPQSIVERLQGGERNVADRVDDATVLFTDLVGFTAIAADHSPDEVVAFLDRVFATFDGLVERHSAEKIKTIGDGYMAAAGVPSQHPRHAAMIADLALDMREAIQNVAPLGGANLQLRIGIGSGPLMAGVIGDKRFAYDLWGDTVNVASRMETSAEPGRIQVSAETRRQLLPDYALEPRGEIEIKGLGQTAIWYLLGRKP